MLGRNTNIRFGGPLTPVVKNLLIANGLVFILQLFASDILINLFGISYNGIFNNFMLWQIVTYMFLHGGIFHILINLLVLWMFGGELEQLWGSRQFLKYYMFSGIGAGFFIAVMNVITYNMNSLSYPTIGASGAIYGLLLAYGMTWPNREILLYFLFPVKVKYFILVIGLIAFYGTLSSATGDLGSISHIGHLGGFITGFFIMMYWSKSSGKKIKKKHKNVLTESIKKSRLKKKKQQIDSRIKAKKIIDELLEKIARNGMSSLSEEERNRLEWARKHYYPDNGDTLH